MKIRYARSAPSGSPIPDSKDQPNALVLLPVAEYTGIATDKPSGMLWIAMATATANPKENCCTGAHTT